MIWQQRILLLLLNGIQQRMEIYYRLKLHQNRGKRFGGSANTDMNGKLKSVIEQMALVVLFAEKIKTISDKYYISLCGRIAL